MIDLFFILFTTGMVMIVVARAMVMDRLVPWFSPDYLRRAAEASANWIVGAFPSLREASTDKVAPSPMPTPVKGGWRSRIETREPKPEGSGWRKRVIELKPKTDTKPSWRDRASVAPAGTGGRRQTAQPKPQGWRDRTKPGRAN